MSTTNAAAGGTLTGLPTGPWRVDPMHSPGGSPVGHLMSRVRGTFREVDGVVVIGPSLLG